MNDFANSEKSRISKKELSSSDKKYYKLYNFKLWKVFVKLAHLSYIFLTFFMRPPWCIRGEL